MSVNFSDLSGSWSGSSLHPLPDRCFGFRKGTVMIAAFSIINVVFVVPFSVAVLCVGFQRYRGRSCASAAAMTRHSDVFACNVAAMALVEVLGSVLYCVGAYTSIFVMALFAYELYCITWCVKLQLNMLTCLEHYLAVVHPVTYLRLKTKTAGRIRNLSILCVWLLLVLWVLVSFSHDSAVSLLFCLGLLSSAFIVVLFCSISVLCVLRRPGPGDVGGRDRDRVDRSKRRAFHTISAIMGALLLSSGGVLVLTSLYVSSLADYSEACLMNLSTIWFGLPCSVVLPLLYLHRVRKLPGCTHDTGSG